MELKKQLRSMFRLCGSKWKFKKNGARSRNTYRAHKNDTHSGAKNIDLVWKKFGRSWCGLIYILGLCAWKSAREKALKETPCTRYFVSIFATHGWNVSWHFVRLCDWGRLRVAPHDHDDVGWWCGISHCESPRWIYEQVFWATGRASLNILTITWAIK